MSKNTGQFETLLQDLDRVKRRQKICKKTINENINNIVNALQNSLTDINNDTAMEEVFTQICLKATQMNRKTTQN